MIAPGRGEYAPAKAETIFSRVESNQETTGSADIARDNGYSAWLDANPTACLDLELGYAHSVHYALNAVSFSVGVNLGHLVRKGPRQ